MLCEVIQLRDKGRRLQRREWPAPVAGDLLTNSLAAHASSYRRHTPMLALYERFGPKVMRTVMTLAFPELMEIGEAGLVWRGVQLDVTGERTVELAQVWLVRPLG